ncbi:39S ribosomal protein L55, mitochondrial [Copidosoma floridanum]|uniref:39S ribosomal protein L55, mitochondrial n=1 Tax=Copidosoma floridanum TaxID=29053 RepID=UPI0006C9A260|nr:39S ribosomal protein L55, mitochondrial [Copidosoma floridanum]
MSSKVSLLLKPVKVFVQSSRNINCWIAAITRPHRKIYLNTYPTIMQLPDGSTINIPYHCPIGVIKLPLDLSTLTEEQKKARLMKRIPKTTVKIQEDIEDDFDSSRYVKYTKKK